MIAVVTLTVAAFAAPPQNAGSEPSNFVPASHRKRYEDQYTTPLVDEDAIPDDSIPDGLVLDESDAPPIAATTVGMRVRVEEIVIPGPQLRARPVADPGRADVIVRVVNVFQHGDGWRYNLEITPFVEGRFDLRDHLQTLDEEPPIESPPLYVEARAVLPGGVMEPNAIEVPDASNVGGYSSRMIALGALWVAVLLGLIFLGRASRGDSADGDEAEPVTLADRLRPLVEEARSGELTTGRRAELERLLLAHWRERRDLTGVHVAEAVSRLRRDEEAGPLFLQLEEWLHRPATDGDAAVDVAALLEPYRNAPDPVRAGALG
ncbi:MAG: hypothetical protein AAGI22_22665 [Planctomycetota bacterium]